MSRRYRHGRPPHRPHRGHSEPAGRATPSSPPVQEAVEPAAALGPVQEQAAGARTPPEEPLPDVSAAELRLAAPLQSPAIAPRADPAGTFALAVDAGNGRHPHRSPDEPAFGSAPVGATGAPGSPEAVLDGVRVDPGQAPGCTAAQLRRFIKSRPWVPMHELRRRFGINGAEDDVSALDVDGRRVFVGLPVHEAGLVAELVRAGDIGIELSLDPGCPMVIGVYPMRPISRG